MPLRTTLYPIPTAYTTWHILCIVAIHAHQSIIDIIIIIRCSRTNLSTRR